jgi:hypothetical protein
LCHWHGGLACRPLDAIQRSYAANVGSLKDVIFTNSQLVQLTRKQRSKLILVNRHSPNTDIVLTLTREEYHETPDIAVDCRRRLCSDSCHISGRNHSRAHSSAGRHDRESAHGLRSGHGRRQRRLRR